METVDKNKGTWAGTGSTGNMLPPHLIQTGFTATQARDLPTLARFYAFFCFAPHFSLFSNTFNSPPPATHFPPQPTDHVQQTLRKGYCQTQRHHSLPRD